MDKRRGNPSGKPEGMIEKEVLLVQIEEAGLDLGPDPEKTLSSYKKKGLIYSKRFRQEGHYRTYFCEDTLKWLKRIKELESKGYDQETVEDFVRFERWLELWEEIPKLYGAKGWKKEEEYPKRTVEAIMGKEKPRLTVEEIEEKFPSFQIVTHDRSQIATVYFGITKDNYWKVVSVLVEKYGRGKWRKRKGVRRNGA